MSLVHPGPVRKTKISRERWISKTIRFPPYIQGATDQTVKLFKKRNQQYSQITEDNDNLS
jgi:hypothetical protein